jgi:hypothetical protein
VDRDNVWKLFPKVSYSRADRCGVLLLFRSHADQRIAKLWVYPFGMLAITHGMLLFSDIAVAQELQNRPPRLLAGGQQLF